MPNEQQPPKSNAARRTVAVLIADLQLGADAGHVLPPRPELARIASTNGGEIASLSPTELVVVFPLVTQAVDSAALVQAACEQLEDGSAASVRAAVHFGELVVRGNVREGPVVTIGRQIAAAAPRGALYLSSEALLHLKADPNRSRVRPPIPLDNGGQLAVHEVAWRKGQRVGTPPMLWVYAAAGVVLLGGLGFLWWWVERTAQPAAPPQAEIAAVAEPAVPAPTAPESAEPKELSPVPAVAGTVDAAAAEPEPEPVAAEDAGAPAKASPGAKVRKGALTLVTIPESTVKERGKVLGKTPLFSVPLAEGTHLLELVGPDGVVRVLSAPIQKGKTAAFRVVLADLPRR